MRVRYTNIVRKLVSHLGVTHLTETLKVDAEVITRWAFDEEEIPVDVVRRLTAYEVELKFVADARKRSTGLFLLFED